MRRIFWVLLIIAVFVMAAMIIEPGFRNAIVYGFQGHVLEPTILNVTGFMAAVTVTPTWISYVQPYLFWYGIGFGMIGLIFTMKVLWPRRFWIKRAPKETKRKLQDKLQPSRPVEIQTQTKKPEPISETVTPEPAVVDEVKPAE